MVFRCSPLLLTIESNQSRVRRNKQKSTARVNLLQRSEKEHVSSRIAWCPRSCEYLVCYPHLRLCLLQHSSCWVWESKLLKRNKTAELETHTWHVAVWTQTAAISSWNISLGVSLQDLCRNFSLFKFPECANKRKEKKIRRAQQSIFKEKTTSPNTWRGLLEVPSLRSVLTFSFHSKPVCA